MTGLNAFVFRAYTILSVYMIMQSACSSHPSSIGESPDAAEGKYLVASSAVSKLAGKTRKLMIFNDVNLMRLKLSENGIGRLHKWMSDEFSYFSITDYYRFGEPSIQNGMDNNLAYYLESKNENYVETVSLILNINNSAEERQALDRFIQVTKKTFHVIGVHIPDRLLTAIKRKESFVYEGESFRTELVPEESKIETLKLVILAK